MGKKRTFKGTEEQALASQIVMAKAAQRKLARKLYHCTREESEYARFIEGCMHDIGGA